MWKAFIEMESKEQAEKAKSNLNNFPIFDDGSNMSVYHSNMQVLNFQNNNSGGVDYTQLKQALNNQNKTALNVNSSPSYSSNNSNSIIQDSPFFPSNEPNEFQNVFSTPHKSN